MIDNAATVNELIATAKAVGRFRRDDGVRGFMHENGRPAVRLTRARFEELFPGIEPEKSWKTYGAVIGGVWFWYNADER